MYKIGDFSKATNTSIKTLRYYDEIDLLKPSYIDYFTGYRYYEKKQINIIKEIKALKDIREKCKVIDESEEIFKLESGLELRLVSLKVEL